MKDPPPLFLAFSCCATKESPITETEKSTAFRLIDVGELYTCLRKVRRKSTENYERLYRRARQRFEPWHSNPTLLWDQIYSAAVGIVSRNRKLWDFGIVKQQILPLSSLFFFKRYVQFIWNSALNELFNSIWFHQNSLSLE